MLGDKGIGCSLSVRYYSEICFDGLGKTLVATSRQQDKTGHLKHDARVMVTAQPRSCSEALLPPCMQHVFAPLPQSLLPKINPQISKKRYDNLFFGLGYRRHYGERRGDTNLKKWRNDD